MDDDTHGNQSVNPSAAKNGAEVGILTYPTTQKCSPTQRREDPTKAYVGTQTQSTSLQQAIDRLLRLRDCKNDQTGGAQTPPSRQVRRWVEAKPSRQWPDDGYTPPHQNFAPETCDSFSLCERPDVSACQRAVYSSSTPPQCRLDIQEFDRRLAERRALVGSSGHVPLSRRTDRVFVAQERLSGRERQRATAVLERHLVDTDATLAGHDHEALAALLQNIPDLPVPGHKGKVAGQTSKQRTPEQQAKLDQMVIWATCGVLPPDVRKIFGRSIAILAVVNRIVDIIRKSTRGCCDWSVAKLAESVGVSTRTVQRAMAVVALGKIAGATVRRPINRGPERTDTNVVTLSDVKEGKRLSKWALGNQWVGRQFGHPKETIGSLLAAIAPDTDPREVLDVHMGHP